MTCLHWCVSTTWGCHCLREKQNACPTASPRGLAIDNDIASLTRDKHHETSGQAYTPANPLPLSHSWDSLKARIWALLWGCPHSLPGLCIFKRLLTAQLITFCLCALLVTVIPLYFPDFKHTSSLSLSCFRLAGRGCWEPWSALAHSQHLGGPDYSYTIMLLSCLPKNLFSLPLGNSQNTLSLYPVLCGSPKSWGDVTPGQKYL